MREYSFTEARQNFASVLEIAKKEGIVCISQQDGESFYLSPATHNKSPFDIPGVNLGVTRDDIVNAVRESREHR